VKHRLIELLLSLALLAALAYFGSRYVLGWTEIVLNELAGKF